MARVHFFSLLLTMNRKKDGIRGDKVTVSTSQTLSSSSATVAAISYIPPSVWKLPKSQDDFLSEAAAPTRIAYLYGTPSLNSNSPRNYRYNSVNNGWLGSGRKTSPISSAAEEFQPVFLNHDYHPGFPSSKAPAELESVH